MTRNSVVPLLIILLVFCSALSAQDGEQTYVLGIAQPFSGTVGSFGQDFERGIKLAVSK